MKQLTIRGEEITGIAMLHEILAAELAFPSWYGANLDALFDCLTDLHEETSITVTGLEELREVLGRRYLPFVRVLTRAAAENEKLTVEGV